LSLKEARALLRVGAEFFKERALVRFSGITAKPLKVQPDFTQGKEKEKKSPPFAYLKNRQLDIYFRFIS
jgi:hypothetical protein